MTEMITREIPRTGERLPAIGLGTWKTFEVGPSERARRPLEEVLRQFFAAGGRLIDSSPMYGNAEQVVGDLLEVTGRPQGLFLATKVWTEGRQAGVDQMNESLGKMRAERIDLMQVHNLKDWETQLATLREWKEQGRFRYIGITHHSHDAFELMERIMRSEQLDFVQLPYSIDNRLAEERLLPVAADTATAVIVMQPFGGGRLFDRVRWKRVPKWAAEFDCRSWAQFYLKFILGHPTVTCPIPATSNPKHLDDNVRAGMGRLPDEKTRRRMIEHLGM